MSRGQTETILVAAEDSRDRESYAGALRAAGIGVRVAADAAEALADYERQPASAVVAAVSDGALIGDLRALDPDATLVVVRKETSVEDTVSLMRDGAFHVLEAPASGPHLVAVAQKALEHGRLSRGNAQTSSNQLDISEKLAMIGRLASGVAHELNNPLDGVRRYLRLTQEGLGQEGEEDRRISTSTSNAP